MRILTKGLSYLLLGVLTCACGEEEEIKEKETDESGANATTIQYSAETGELFLALSDFSNPDADDLIEDDFKEEFFDSIERFYVKDPNVSDSPVEPSCTDIAIDEGVTITSDGKVMKFEGTVEAIHCVKEEPEEGDTFAMKVFGYKICQEGEFSSVEGKTMTELGEEDYGASGCGEVHSLGLMSMDADLTIDIEGTIYRQQLSFKNYFGQSPTEACILVYDEDNLTVDGCIDETVSVSTVTIGEDQPIETRDHSKEVENALVRPTLESQTFFTSGGLQGNINNWQYTVSFQGGETAPLWTATDGTTVIEETFEDPYQPPVPSASLFLSKSRKINQLFR